MRVMKLLYIHGTIFYNKNQVSSDNTWFKVYQGISDTVHVYGPAGYMTELDNGILLELTVQHHRWKAGFYHLEPAGKKSQLNLMLIRNSCGPADVTLAIQLAFTDGIS